MSYIKKEFDKICITNLKLVGLTEWLSLTNQQSLSDETN